MAPDFAHILINALPQIWNTVVAFWVQLLSNPAVFWPLLGMLALGLLTRLAPRTSPRRRRRRA
jgi:hypothetical protein